MWIISFTKTYFVGYVYFSTFLPKLPFKCFLSGAIFHPVCYNALNTETPKPVFLQTVTTQMKCIIIIKVYVIFRTKYNIFLTFITCLTSLDTCTCMCNGLSQVYCTKSEGRIYLYTKNESHI